MRATRREEVRPRRRFPSSPQHTWVVVQGLLFRILNSRLWIQGLVFRERGPGAVGGGRGFVLGSGRRKVQARFANMLIDILTRKTTKRACDLVSGLEASSSIRR